MAITPNEIRDRQLRESNKLLDELADRLESKIDRELRETSKSPAYTASLHLDVPDSWIDALSQKPSILEDVKQRYIEKGWKDVKFIWRWKGKIHEDTGIYYGGSIGVELVPYPKEVPDFVKVILGVVGILLLSLLIKSC